MYRTGEEGPLLSTDRDTNHDDDDDDSPTSRRHGHSIVNVNNNSTHSASSERSFHSYASTILEQYYLNFSTNSERDIALSKEGVGAAAFLIRDACCGDPLTVENPAEGTYDPYQYPEAKLRNTVSVLCRRLCAYRPLVHLLHGTAWLLVVLTFLEPPHWCRDNNDNSITNTDNSTNSNGKNSDSAQDANGGGCARLLTMTGLPADKIFTLPGDNDSLDDVQLYPNSNSMFLTVSQSRSIEWMCLAIILIFILLRIGRDGMSITRFLRPGTSRHNRVAQLVCLIVMAIGLWTRRTHYQAYFRLALLVSYSTAAQRDIQVVVRMFPKVVNILTLLFVFTLFYAWFGTVMFVGTPEGRQIFSSFVESLWTLWICVTTANCTLQQ